VALLDAERNVVVIRVVYDGPPEAGKTTSLRALAGSLGQPLFSPSEENGRTLFFDWMDYTAGRFEGYQIRCQIVSVPGQKELGRRRRQIIAHADVVVFVADTTRERLPATMEFLRDLPGLLTEIEGPPLGVILQANKRDLPSAVPLPELRQALEQAGHQLGVVESIAADGAGIRETFVFAVRLALDRVRELLRVGTLASGRPEIDTGDELLAAMQAAEATPAPALIREVLEENWIEPEPEPEPEEDPQLEKFAPWRARVEDEDEDDRGPRPPDPSAPSGAIWPPVEGRLVLHEACGTGLETHKLRSGAWAAGLGSGWRAHSAGTAIYPDVDQGRAALVQWARLHAACGGLLSPRRCIVLADAGNGTYRLWQIVRAEASLREGLLGLDKRTPEDAATRLAEAATLLYEMEAKLRLAPCHVPCTLDTIGRGDGSGAYIALMPGDVGTAPSTVAGPELVRTQIEPLLQDLYDRRLEVLSAIERVSRRVGRPRGAELVREALGALSPRSRQRAVAP
jgi:signal recognition particle receptor subunit beta